jgi:hypothetical protein
MIGSGSSGDDAGKPTYPASQPTDDEHKEDLQFLQKIRLALSWTVSSLVDTIVTDNTIVIKIRTFFQHNTKLGITCGVALGIVLSLSFIFCLKATLIVLLSATLLFLIYSVYVFVKTWKDLKQESFLPYEGLI